jgi:hypothetical protein
MRTIAPGGSEDGFGPYPTNRVVGTIHDADIVADVVDALCGAGFDRQVIDVLRAAEGLNRLSPAARRSGLLGRLKRALVRERDPVEEYEDVTGHLDALRAGRFVVAVLAPSADLREVAADVLNAHGAQCVGFYGRSAWEWLSSQIGTPETEPAAVRRQLVEAWAGAMRMRWRRLRPMRKA